MDFLRVLLVLAVATALALCVVWQGSLARRAGRELEQMQQELAALKAQEQKHRAEIDRLKSPERIMVQAIRLGLEQARSEPRPEHGWGGGDAAVKATDGSADADLLAGGPRD